MHVSPSVARAPALLTIRVTVEAAPENRSLQVVAESSDFYRSSQVQIDGVNAVPRNVFEFRNLPSGLYQVTGTLGGVHGPRAKTWRWVKVDPSVGSGR